MSHAFESVWNKNANPISTQHALFAIDLILKNLPALPQNLQNLNLRETLMRASIHAGLAFSNTQTALAHALSYPLTLKFNTPHGLAAAFSLPAMMKSLPEGEPRELLLPFLPRVESLFKTLKIHEDLDFLGESDIAALFENLNPRAKNSVLNVEKVKENLIAEFSKN